MNVVRSSHVRALFKRGTAPNVTQRRAGRSPASGSVFIIFATTAYTRNTAAMRAKTSASGSTPMSRAAIAAVAKELPVFHIGKSETRGDLLMLPAPRRCRVTRWDTIAAGRIEGFG